MLGPPKPRRLADPIAVSLEGLVPRDNFDRHLEAKLDLGFVREWARELSADRGRPGIDPVVFFKLQLVMFFERIRSERKLVETASLHLAHRWYLGYRLDETLPDHSSLTRIRQRLGVEVFARFFEQVVDLCQEAGLVWGRELFFDATKVRANADLDSLVPRFYHEAKTHVAGVFADEPADVASDDERPAPANDLPPWIVRLPSEPVDGSLPANGPPWRLLEERRLDPNRPPSGTYQRTSDWRVSTTDPDATPMRVEGATRLGYHDHYVVGGGKARIVLAALVTPADVMENAPMRDLLWRVRFRRKLRPRQVIGDTTYGTIENIVAIEREGIRAYVPLPDFDHRTPFFGKGGYFAYDAEADAYRCPGGAELRPLKHQCAQPARIDQAPTAACNSCPLKTRCTASRRGRRVRRSAAEPYLDRVRSYHQTGAYARALRKRKVWVEPLFAEAKDWHGLRRFRLRGLPNGNVEGLLVAAGQNLKRFLVATGWGRRHAPCGSLVALSGPPRRPADVCP